METQMPEEAVKNARASQTRHRLDTMDHYRKLIRGLLCITDELLDVFCPRDSNGDYTAHHVNKHLYGSVDEIFRVSILY